MPLRRLALVPLLPVGDGALESLTKFISVPSLCLGGWLTTIGGQQINLFSTYTRSNTKPFRLIPAQTQSPFIFFLGPHRPLSIPTRRRQATIPRCAPLLLNFPFTLISMAPNTRAQRQGHVATALCPSIETNADSTPPVPDSINPSKHSNTGPRPDQMEDSQSPETPVPQVRAMVIGVEMQMPRTWDPETYDPEKRMPWTPEPEPYDPETYAAWGRKHFGEEWYELRKTMLEERNIYYDPVYQECQRALRIMEHKVEGRPFKPRFDIGPCDEDWKILWARLSKDLGIPSNPASPTPSKDNDDSDTDLDGYNTYPPSPTSSHESTPPPEDPWERLEYDRKVWDWDEEQYQFERMFLKESLIDGARSRRENEPGDRQYREKREVMESFRYVDSDRFRLERDYFEDHIDLAKKGWTTEQIIAQYEAEVALLEWQRKEFPTRESYHSWEQRLNAQKIRVYGELPPESLDVPVKSSLSPGDTEAMELWRKGIHARLSRRQQRDALTDAKGDASARAEALQRIEDEERRDREVVERALERAEEMRPRPVPPNSFPLFIRSQEEMNDWFRVWDGIELSLEKQNELARSYGFGKRPAAREAVPQSPTTAPQPAKDTSRNTRGGGITKNAPTHTEASPRTSPQGRNRQRKAYKKERASRRLAKMEPEYGMLGGGETRPSSRQPSNTRRTSTSCPRSVKVSKKPTAARSAKPQGIVKSGRAGTSRPKRPAK